jgi:hypothetical protein
MFKRVFPTAGRAVAFTVALVAVLGVTDFVTGTELGFFVFYFIPISIAAWGAGAQAGVAIAVLSAAAWFVSDYLSRHAYSYEWFQLWNTTIRLISFVLIAYVVARVRMLLDKERALTAALQKALDEVKTLSGLLPICAKCKKIRNDGGYWQRIEEYLSEHADVQFTHGFCQECAAEYLREAGLDPDAVLRSPGRP